MNQHISATEKADIQALRNYLQNKFKASGFGGLSLEKDYHYFNDIQAKYPNNPSVLIAQGYLEWRFGNKNHSEMLFEKAYVLAKDINYDLQWFEIGVNTFLGSSYNEQMITSKTLLPDFRHLHVTSNKSPLILASCDDVYFQKFGRFFMDICLKHSKGAVHIHVINPSEKTMNFFEKRTGARLSFSIEYSENKYPAYYALNRFLIAPFILEAYNTDILVVDIDQAISRNIDNIIKRLSNNSNDIALPTLKTSWMPWNYYLAGNVYLKNNTKIKEFLNCFINYSNQAIKRLGSYEKAWFIDQNAMFKAISFLEEIGGEVGYVQEYGRIAVGPEGAKKEDFSKLLQLYNSHINFSGKLKLMTEDDFLFALKSFLNNKEFSLMFFESFFNRVK